MNLKVNKMKIICCMNVFNSYQWINDEIVKLNNLMLIDLYNHQLMNLTLLNHHMDQIKVLYQIKMDRKYLKNEK